MHILPTSAFAALQAQSDLVRISHRADTYTSRSDQHSPIGRKAFLLTMDSAASRRVFRRFTSGSIQHSLISRVVRVMLCPCVDTDKRPALDSASNRAVFGTVRCRCAMWASPWDAVSVTLLCAVSRWRRRPLFMVLTTSEKIARGGRHPTPTKTALL